MNTVCHRIFLGGHNDQLAVPGIRVALLENLFMNVRFSESYLLWFAWWFTNQNDVNNKPTYGKSVASKR